MSFYPSNPQDYHRFSANNDANFSNDYTVSQTPLLYDGFPSSGDMTSYEESRSYFSSEETNSQAYASSHEDSHILYSSPVHDHKSFYNDAYLKSYQDVNMQPPLLSRFPSTSGIGNKASISNSNLYTGSSLSQVLNSLWSVPENTSSKSHKYGEISMSLSGQRVMVPENLSLKTTILLDLVATKVKEGGSLVEEELRSREKNNPNFNFLRDKWDTPESLYYRWRLYSLLQGDSLFEWFFQPFQIESGSGNVVWIPPRFVPEGTQWLEVLPHSPQLREIMMPSRGTALWISRVLVTEGVIMPLLTSSDEILWRELLDIRLEAINEYDISEETMIFESFLLDRNFIAKRMHFVLERRPCSVHAVSILVDHLIVLAKQWQLHVEESLISDSHRHFFSFEARCTYALCYLFILSDILMNLSRGQGATFSHENTEKMDSTSSCGARRKADGSSRGKSRSFSRRPWELKQIEKLLPTVIEAVLHICCDISMSKDSLRVGLEDSSGVCFHLQLDFPTYTGIHDSSGSITENHPQSLLLVGLLLQWLRSLCLLWYDENIIGRVWATIQENYSFLFSESMDET